MLKNNTMTYEEFIHNLIEAGIIGYNNNHLNEDLFLKSMLIHSEHVLNKQTKESNFRFDDFDRIIEHFCCGISYTKCNNFLNENCNVEVNNENNIMPADVCIKKTIRLYDLYEFINNESELYN